MEEAIFNLPDPLDAAAVDHLAEQIRNAGADRIILRVDRVPRIQLFGEGRLLGLLAAERACGSAVTIALGIGKADLLRATAGKYYRLLQGTSTGFVLTELASEIDDNEGRDLRSDLKERLQAALSARGGLIGDGKQLSALRTDRLGRPADASEIWDARIDDFRQYLAVGILRSIGVNRFPLRITDPLIDFLFEAVSNTRDHATRDLQGDLHGGVRLLTVRRINMAEEPLGTLRTGENTGLDEYLGLLEDEWQGIPEILMEVSVADSGLGVPATITKDESIYRGDFKDELQILRRAMKERVTSKSPGAVGAGQGFLNMLEAVDQLSGLFAIRTGRSSAYRHYLGDTPQWPDTSLLVAGEAPGPLIRGTCVSVLLPAGTAARRRKKGEDWAQTAIPFP